MNTEVGVRFSKYVVAVSFLISLFAVAATTAVHSSSSEISATQQLDIVGSDENLVSSTSSIDGVVVQQPVINQNTETEGQMSDTSTVEDSSSDVSISLELHSEGSSDSGSHNQPSETVETSGTLKINDTTIPIESNQSVNETYRDEDSRVRVRIRSDVEGGSSLSTFSISASEN